MKFFPITKKRLLHHIEYDIRKSALGIINWFMDQEGVLNIILSIRGIDYIYREAITSKEDIHPDVLPFITEKTEVLGIVDLEKEYEEDVPEPSTVEQYFELKRLR